jgi:hypothetical protein
MQRGIMISGMSVAQIEMKHSPVLVVFLMSSSVYSWLYHSVAQKLEEYALYALPLLFLS